jgi:hypothetical protein
MSTTTPTPTATVTTTATPTPVECSLDETQSPPVCGGDCPSPDRQCLIGEDLVICTCQRPCEGQDPAAEGVCDGGCPSPDQACRVTPDGACHCVPSTDVCQDRSAILNLMNGVCGGLCPRPEDTCRYDGVTGGDSCLCLPPLTTPDTPAQPCGLDLGTNPPVCAGFCPNFGEVCEDTGGEEGCVCSTPPNECGFVDTAGGPQCGGLCPQFQYCLEFETPEAVSCECSSPSDVQPCLFDHEFQVCGGDCPSADLFCQARAGSDPLHVGNFACACLPRYQRPCTLDVGESPPLCLGVCPNGEVCVDVGAPGEPGCACEPLGDACGLQADGACGGPCPRPGDVCLGSLDGICGCLPPTQACQNESAVPDLVICGGGCPRPGDLCTQDQSEECRCLPPAPAPTPTEAVVTPAPSATPSATATEGEATTTATRTATPTTTPIPSGPACGDTQPVCNGACPGTQLCRVGPSGCECMTACPEDLVGECDGACPFGEVCLADGSGDCGCDPAEAGSKTATANIPINCPTNGSIAFFVDTFIPNAAQNPEQIRTGQSQLCPGAPQQERVRFYGPGVTPPNGQTPPSGTRAFRREIEIGTATEAAPLPIIGLLTFFDLPP